MVEVPGFDDDEPMDDDDEGSDKFDGYGSWITFNFHCSCGKKEVHVFPSWMDGVECTQCGRFHGHNAGMFRRDFAIEIHTGQEAEE